MADNCGSYVSADDLRAAKQSILHIEHVATSKDAQGNPALTVTDTIRGNDVTNTTLDGLFSDIGFKPVNGSFEDGATLNNRWEVLLYESNGQYYQWEGVLPKVVPAGSTPSTTGGIASGAWVDRSDLTLRSELASSDPDKGRNLVYDAASETVLNSVKLKTDHFVTPEFFSNQVASGDWTTAINSAFSSGLPVLLSSDYNVSGIINTKGQRILGKGNIITSRYTLGSVIAQTIDPDNESIRMLYVESAYDLAELLHIKSLGFNMINHYCTFANNGTIDAAGTAEQMLDNAYTAGLKVNIGLDNPRSNANLAEFVNATKDHPATWGYSVYDEPATHGVSVATQDARITTLRGLTTKKLSFVDLIADTSFIFNQVFSTNYDVAFVDSYSRHYTSGTYAQWLKDDLNKFRFDMGAISQMTGLRVIPVVSAFVENTSNDYYSRDINQIVPASRILGKVAEGDFGAFVWDGASANFDGVVRDNSTLKSLCKELSSQRKRKPVKFQAYLFGGTPSSTKWGILNLIRQRMITDSSTSDGNVQGYSYPIRLRTGTTETDRTTTNSGYDFSGLAFSGAFASWNSGIRIGVHTRLHLEYFNLGPALPGTFQLRATDDNGYTISEPTYATGLNANAVFSADITPGDIGVNPDSTMVFRMDFLDDTTTVKRKFLRGLVISSDW